VRARQRVTAPFRKHDHVSRVERLSPSLWFFHTRGRRPRGPVLPTGSGKTLVGLLIGEWLRRKNKERVVFLCPTRQLVNQVIA
jgi:hypothetical protein